MNNIAIQNRTDKQGISPAIIFSELRPVLAVAVLALIWVSFRPFSGGSAEEIQSSVLNQIGYTGLLAVTLFTLVTTVDRRAIFIYLSAPWMLIIALFIFSTASSPIPADAYRAVAFTLIAFLLAASFIVLPRNADELSNVLAIACFFVLGLSYAGVVLWPNAAVHQFFEAESQHGGLWRGIFSHKNITGPIMAVIVFAGVYLIRRGRWISGAAIGLLALFFIAQTGSKTSLIVAPAVAAIILLPTMAGMRGLAAFLVLAAVLTTHAMTIGTVYSSTLDAILRSIDPVTTFTGRIGIWEFSKPFVMSNLWSGYGYGGFWLSDLVLTAEKAFDSDWDPRGIIHGHNGYLDIVLVMGLPAMLLLVWLSLIAPIIDYLRVPKLKENIFLSDFLFMIVAFTAMNSALESFYFRRIDPVWLTLVIALFGLRLVARLPVKAR
ncbi:O-antigen ligase [Ahrensia sp. 13_GOM-1096m]|uniref:O-antigen ligase family protein n=1 Tax=Ahrensia sp. 13_GOM-1096m TaxID=1380380 RepID=UPI0004798691|nr:O-antigen ligase [Ahrensia sp. 13_GOM-1096m]